MNTMHARRRLTAWYAGSILLLLLLTTVAARTIVRNALEEEFARSQESAAALVRGFFRAEVMEYRATELTLEHIVGELVIPDRHIHFLRPGGAEFLPPAYVKVMPLPELAPPVREVVRTLDQELAPGWSVRISSSAAPLVRQQRSVDQWAVLAIPLALIAAIIAGWMLTGRTLRPVDDAMARQRRFLADAAHELRTPIARARGAGELALSVPSGPDDRDALARTQRELEGMSRLVDELLELARADASRPALPLVREFLDDVVADVVQRFDPLARRFGVSLQLEMPEEAPIRMERVSLERLIGVLVDNAIRYSPADAVVHVRVLNAPSGVRLEVEDAGIGIPPEEHGRLFERFFRGAEARRRAPDGSGLGLPIAAAVAELHAARIRFERASPQGTRVVVDFPRA
jgi:two-component system, OmpR family, sensor kinase